MFSSRLNWGIPANPLSRLLAQKRTSGAAILDLTESNPTSAGFTYPVDRILPALADPRSLCYEPAPAGILAARSAVSRYYGGKVDAERILLTASTSEAYALLFKLLADPGDEVLVPRASYPLFDFLATLESVRPAPYAVANNGEWSINMDGLETAITPRTRAVILVNPNNPTGSFLKREEMKRLFSICKN